MSLRNSPVSTAMPVIGKRALEVGDKDEEDEEDEEEADEALGGGGGCATNGLRETQM